MNYRAHYDKLITRAKARDPVAGYVESHHIKPKCVGGSDDGKNLVELTAREHYVAHQLLAKIYPESSGLLFAQITMTANNSLHGHNRSHNRLYGWLKEKYSEFRKLEMLGQNNPSYGSRWMNNGAISKRISSKEVSLHESLGWEYGKVKMERRCIECAELILGSRSERCPQHREIANSKRNRNAIESARNASIGNSIAKGRTHVTNGMIDKMIILTEGIPEGFWVGRTQGKRKSGAVA